MAANALTKKQRGLVQALLDPKVKTQGQAARIAGYSDKSADSIASRMTKNVNVVSALTQSRTSRRDKASSIFDHSADRVESAIRDKDVDPSFALGAFKVSADVLNTVDDESPRIDYAGIRERQRARDAVKMLSAIKIAQRVGLERALTLLYPRLPSRMRNVINVEHENVEPAGLIEGMDDRSEGRASEGEVP